MLVLPMVNKKGLNTGEVVMPVIAGMVDSVWDLHCATLLGLEKSCRIFDSF
jgi:hypothetical protein